MVLDGDKTLWSKMAISNFWGDTLIPIPMLFSPYGGKAKFEMAWEWGPGIYDQIYRKFFPYTEKISCVGC